jgi:aldose 1-epimerase
MLIFRSVKGTPFDFTTPVTIGARIEESDEQLIFGKGYDQNFVLTKTDKTLGLAARVHEPTTGRILEVWTTEPGVQV